MPPRISVIIPCYNQARYLKEAVDSVLAQRYPDTEILIVDDGSTDETFVVANQLADDCPGRILPIHQANQGLAMARQAGFEALKGTFFVMLDADDLLEPGMFAASLAAFERHPGADAAIGDAVLFDDSRPAQGRVLRPRLPVTWPGVLESNPIGACHAALLRTRSVERIGGLGLPGVRACEDWDLWARMGRCRMNCVPVPAVVCRYRQHAGVLSRRTALMLQEKIKLIERCSREDARLAGAGVDPLPPISARYGQQLCNGAVFYAIGHAAGAGSPAGEIEQLLTNLTPGGFAFRHACNQFLYGLGAACNQQPGIAPWPEDAIARLTSTLHARLIRCGHQAVAGAIRHEIRRELRNPGKKKSLRRRLSRLLDPLRAWISANSF